MNSAEVVLNLDSPYLKSLIVLLEKAESGMGGGSQNQIPLIGQQDEIVLEEEV